MNNIEIIHHFTESMSDMVKNAILNECEKRRIAKAYVFNIETPTIEGSFQVCEHVDEHAFSVDKTGTILCKNNSGQLSVNKGTTLIGVVNDNGTLRQVEQSGCIDSNYAKGMDNHGQRTLAMIVQRGRGQNKGGIKAEDGKTPTVSANRWEQNNHLLWGKQPRQQDRVNVGEKSRCVPASSNGSASHFTKTLVGSKIRRLTPTEVCRLFNVPDRYFHDKDSNLLVSESQQYKALGNGWVVDVIAHIFSFIPDKISQNG